MPTTTTDKTESSRILAARARSFSHTHAPTDLVASWRRRLRSQRALEFFERARMRRVKVQMRVFQRAHEARKI